MLSHAPTSFALADLTDLTRIVADEVRAGSTPSTSTRCDRWYRLLRSDDFVDVWLISWATSQAAELHDHAGSLGALTVVSGRLRRAALDGHGRCAPARCGRAAAPGSRSGTCTTWRTGRSSPP